MKRLFYLLSFVILFSLPLLIIGCSNNDQHDNPPYDSPPTNEQTQLVAPIPKWEDNLIIWNKINNATSYKINLNG